MAWFKFNRLRFALALILLSSFITSCSSSANNQFFGKTQVPKDNVLRYISGSESESLDPQVSSGQPEARIYMAIYEGLVEYGPKDMQPIPAIAKSWETNSNYDEYIFHLRDNAKFSDGTPITAKDFVWSWRRGFAPETLSRTASLGYFIKYAEDFNGGKVFVKNNGQFVLAKDAAKDEPKNDQAKSETKPENAPVKSASFGPETEFHKFIQSPARLTLDGDEKKRAEQIEKNPKLKVLTEGAEFVPVTGEDIGVEAVDDYTLRVTLRQPAPFFLGLMAYQFFRVIPKHVVEKHGKNWSRAENIVTSGAYRVKIHRPYNEMIVERDPNYWDAANVHLDGIEFYPIEELSTIMNLYKAGSVDAFLNHAVPASWIDEIRPFKDEYLDFPENAVSYYSMNVTKPPFDNPKVRRAFSLAIDRVALAKFRKVQQPFYFQTPTGIFPDYDKAMEKIGEEVRAERKMSPEEWQRELKQFDPERAKKLLSEAGFTVANFPSDKVAITYNTGESNKAIAEFIQAQWKQNLGITVTLKNMEFKTFLPHRNALEYEGFAQSLWSGDYMDPFTFLGLHYGAQNDGGSGFNDPKYDQLLDEANAELDQQKRYEKLARAEYYLMDKMPSMPLMINATNWMKKPYVKGLYPNPGTLMAWKFTYIERDPNKWDKNVENIMKETDPQVEAQLNALKATQTQK